MKNKENKEGRITFENGKLVINHTKKPVIQFGTEMIVLRKPIYKN